MPIPLLTTGSAGLAFVLAAAGAGTARAAEPVEPIGDVAAVRCTPLDGDLLDVQVKPNGQLKLVFAGDGVPTCDEVMVVSSYAGAGPVVDNHDPMLDQIGFQVSELEAAGPAGVTVAPVLDPCWAALEVLRDGDTFMWEDVLGDGCEMEITTDFAAGPWDTEIHVVQQSGNIQPPHIFDHDADESTVLTGLPDGTWYVKVYEGAVAGTTMAVDGGAAQATTIVNGVPDGAEVLVHHPWRRTLVGDLHAP